MSFNNEIDAARIPRHVAIIMDGNGRWAKAKGLPRTAGHQEGVETVKKITEEAVRLGVKYLTLYTFSTENWNRPVPEIAALMGLILDHLEGPFGCIQYGWGDTSRSVRCEEWWF